MDNQTRRQILDRARATGYPGDILEAFSAYDQGRDLVQEYVQQQQMQPPRPLSNSSISLNSPKPIFLKDLQTFAIRS